MINPARPSLHCGFIVVEIVDIGSTVVGADSFIRKMVNSLSEMYAGAAALSVPLIQVGGSFHCSI